MSQSARRDRACQKDNGGLTFIALEDAGDGAYNQATSSRFVRDVQDELVSLYPATPTVVTDDPDKLLNEMSGECRIPLNLMTKIDFIGGPGLMMSK